MLRPEIPNCNGIRRIKGYIMKKMLALLAVTTALGAVAMNAQAADLNSDIWAKERFRVRGRMIGVMPEESSNVNIGGHLDIGNAYVPEVDVSYFFSKNIAVELIAATSNHSIKYSGSEVGDAWILPPTATLQYHITPEKKFSPYVGAGLNYSFFYGEDSAAGFSNLKVDNGFGYALQAGFDYWLDDHWGLNFDVKKLFLNVDATVNNGAVRADIDLDPWIVGAGVSYRF